ASRRSSKCSDWRATFLPFISCPLTADESYLGSAVRNNSTAIAHPDGGGIDLLCAWTLAFWAAGVCTADIYRNANGSMKLVRVSRPPVQTVMESGVLASWLPMLRARRREIFSKRLEKLAGALLLLAGLASLVGCQGVSTGTKIIVVGQLTLNPASEAFGSVAVGDRQSQTVTVTNSGSSVSISQVSVSGTGFQLSGITTPLTLNASQSTTFTVAFAPQTTGSASGTVTLTSNASDPTLAIGLSGTGTTATGQLAVSPTTLALGSVEVDTSGTASGSLSASGASVTVTAASTNDSVFSVGGLSLPVTIPAGQSVPFTVTFSPLTTEAASATLTFTSNVQPSTTTEALTGTGTSAPTHTVNLSWDASTSPNISGYNIYRAVYSGSCGSYSKVNSVLNTSTLYTDSSVVDGTSYCYTSTAVTSSNEESGYSNIVSNVQIPAS